jgi:Oxysterol-binding protein
VRPAVVRHVVDCLQGETFEYVRLDKKYRYYSEQVSHHPPISACWAEAPNWRYYGEVPSAISRVLLVLLLIYALIGRCSEQIHGEVV